MVREINEFVDIDISEDMMSVAVCLRPVTDSEIEECTYENIIKLLREKGVVAGVNSDAIESLVNDKNFDKYVVVAEGIPVVEGEDGRYIFHFDSSPSKKPKLLENGCVDYYNLNLISSVEVGDLLAEYVPKTDGNNGITVKGAVLTCKKNKDLPELRGSGFSVDEDGKYYAAQPGKVELNMGRMIVSPICTIPGDVDLSVGNVDFKGDLEILGTIKAGMTVKATGNITVNKRVEAATVSAGKELLVRGGILGGGKADISAIGNVFAQFIENANVSSGGSIQADAIVNSHVVAYKDVNIFGKNSTIVGGTLKANRRIRTRYLGSETCVKTLIEVGIDEGVNASLKELENEMKAEDEELNKIEKAIELCKDKKDVDPKMYMQLVRTKIDKTANIHRVRELYDQIKRRVEVGKYAEVVVEKRIYPGVRLLIDGKASIIDNEYEEIVFKRKGDRILSKRFVEDEYDED